MSNADDLTEGFNVEKWLIKWYFFSSGPIFVGMILSNFIPFETPLFGLWITIFPWLRAKFKAFCWHCWGRHCLDGLPMKRTFPPPSPRGIDTGTHRVPGLSAVGKGIPYVLGSPLRIGLFPFQMDFLWLINGGTPKITRISEPWAESGRMWSQERKPLSFHKLKLKAFFKCRPFLYSKRYLPHFGQP